MGSAHNETDKSDCTRWLFQSNFILIPIQARRRHQAQLQAWQGCSIMDFRYCKLIFDKTYPCDILQVLRQEVAKQTSGHIQVGHVLD